MNKKIANYGTLLQRGNKVFEEIFGVNGFWGHILTMLLFMVPAMLDTLGCGVRPAEALFFITAGLIIIVPVMTPAKGIDRVEERKQLLILTFGTAGIFGVILGFALSAGLLSITGGNIMKMEPRYFCFSNISAVAVCISMYFSYFQVGHLSRSFLNDLQEQFGRLMPPPLAWTIEIVYNWGRSCAARRLMSAFKRGHLSAIFGEGWEKLKPDHKFEPAPVPKGPSILSLLIWVFKPIDRKPGPPLWSQTLWVVKQEMEGDGHTDADRQYVENHLQETQMVLLQEAQGRIRGEG